MVTMMLMTGIPLSTQEIRKQVAKAVDLIVHVELFLDGKRRTTAISDVWYDEDKDKVYLKNIIEFKQTGMREDGAILGDWTIEKTRPSILDKFAKRMVKLPDGFFGG
jgi:pilus assembly protein CpaF